MILFALRVLWEMDNPHLMQQKKKDWNLAKFGFSSKKRKREGAAHERAREIEGEALPDPGGAELVQRDVAKIMEGADYQLWNEMIVGTITVGEYPAHIRPIEFAFCLRYHENDPNDKGIFKTLKMEEPHWGSPMRAEVGGWRLYVVRFNRPV